ncbi:hypothetical protein HZA97_08215 [Candidatus Woesearchaeota archaeon]|nr:hypothetical protein [Candidatus Woesearchaeota archaeon]
MKTLKELAELYKLKQIVQDSRGDVNTSKLEKDFLAFSAYSQKKVLKINFPNLYQLQDEEHMHFAAALSALDIKGVKSVDYLDFSGAYALSTPLDVVILMSLSQAGADNFTQARSHMNPLIGKIYLEGGAMIRDFSIHEALVGKVVSKRGALDLKEIVLFPEKFTPGPYQLSVRLETPMKTVEKLRELTELIKDFEKDPEQVLDPKAVDKVTTRALNLRKILGSLSRYQVIENQEVSAETNSCVIKNEKSELFYLYSPEKNVNVLVYFGENPFENAKIPQGLLILPGKDYQHVLLKLLDLGFYQPSTAVVEQRVKDLNEIYEAASRGLGKSLDEEYQDFDGLLKELDKTRRTFKDTINPSILVRYAMQLKPELLEFVLCPSTSDPVVHELLPRLSWNQAIRNYHNTKEFTGNFKRGSEQERKAMLDEVVSSLLFGNQQNNDVNLWLYKKYKQFCTNSGIVFDGEGTEDD